MIDSRFEGLTPTFMSVCHRLWTRIVPLMRNAVLSVSALVLLACQQQSDGDMSAADKKAIADSLKTLVVNAYDLSKPDPVKSLMSLYPDSGRVISAAAAW